MPKTLLTILAMIVVSVGLSACANTVTGVSKDMKDAGQEIKQTGHAVKRAVN